MNSDQQLILLTVPNRILGNLPIFDSFDGLQNAFKMPFVDSLPWRQLNSTALEYYGDSTTVRLSILREFACSPLKSKMVDYKINQRDFTLHLCPFDLSRFAEKPAAEPIVIPPANFSQGKTDTAGAFVTMRLPDSIDSARFQFLRLKLKSKISQNCNRIQLFWKSSQMNTFALEAHKDINAKDWKNRDEITLDLGERIDWLRMPNIDNLAFASDETLQLESATLLPDFGLVPRFTPSPGRCQELAGTGLVARDGKFYFDYDASRIPGACAVRVELSAPATWFSADHQTFQDDRFAAQVQSTWVFHSSRGSFEIPDCLNSPVFHQIRIFALDKNGRPLGYSSDPIYVQSKENHLYD